MVLVCNQLHEKLQICNMHDWQFFHCELDWAYSENGKRHLFVTMLVKINDFFQWNNWKLRISRLYEQLDDCEFFDAVAQLKLSAV